MRQIKPKVVPHKCNAIALVDWGYQYNYVFCLFLITRKEQFAPNGALGWKDYQFTTDSKAPNGAKGFDFQCKLIH